MIFLWLMNQHAYTRCFYKVRASVNFWPIFIPKIFWKAESNGYQLFLWNYWSQYNDRYMWISSTRYTLEVQPLKRKIESHSWIDAAITKDISIAFYRFQKLKFVLKFTEVWHFLDERDHDFMINLNWSRVWGLIIW